MNKKGLGFNLVLGLGCGLIIYILAAPVAYTIINDAVGGMGEVEGFICKGMLLFGLLIWVIMLYNAIRNRGGMFTP